MSNDRSALPQLRGGVFLADGGLETTLVFLEGIDLPSFAAFPLVLSETGRDALTRYFAPYLAEAKRRGVGFVLDTATWRANPDWGEKLGFGLEDLLDANRRAVSFAADLRDAVADRSHPIVLNGVVGPRGDGYVVGAAMTADEAARYHRPQIEALRDAGADMISAITMTYAEEAVGIARAARDCGIPVAISFTVETDGRLPSGQPLRSAIEDTDAATGSFAAYYMINCAHPEHFKDALTGEGAWLDRIGGVRANASRKSHAELDAATELDIGDPEELGRHYRDLRGQLRRLCVLGGCCGTDHRHVKAICDACL
ncbi:MAG TPA: homocysteine S-methyltransferase family protein [Microvirga sp.]|nr:homocysteine S-methyltransferase family protein [Microvirga sp.]